MRPSVNSSWSRVRGRRFPGACFAGEREVQPWAQLPRLCRLTAASQLILDVRQRDCGVQDVFELVESDQVIDVQYHAGRLATRSFGDVVGFWTANAYPLLLGSGVGPTLRSASW